METDINRYRSRILREMKANRENPFNSPPSSTGSHGTVSPTLSSVFSDPEGESTRRLNEDIARVTAPRKLPVNWEAANRKWPEFYSVPKSRTKPIFGGDDDDTDTRPLSAESKENKPPAAYARYSADDSTQDAWLGSNRTRAEMQPRVDNESDLSSILSKSPARGLSARAYSKNNHHHHNPSPLAKVHTRSSSNPVSPPRRRGSISDAIERLRHASNSPKYNHPPPEQDSPRMSSAKSSLTAVPPSPTSLVGPDHNETTNVRSFYMPDVSHLGDFVDGTLQFSGAMRNGVPVFVKNGRVHDRREKSSSVAHAQVDGLELPEDEEKIFVSMDMIREEIVSLQEHYDKVSEYAENLQHQVEHLETQLRSQRASEEFVSHQVNEKLMAQKNRLELEVTTLQTRLEHASRKNSIGYTQSDAVSQEKDRTIRKLQEACEDINKLTRKLSSKEKELETTRKQLESTEQMRYENESLRRELVTVKHGRDSLELQITSLKTENEKLQEDLSASKQEPASLRTDNNAIRREHESLIAENRSLRMSNKALMEENEDLRENLDGVQQDLDLAREELEMQEEYQNFNTGDQKSTLQEDNESLVRHNEKYFNENKILRRENSGFERTIRELHEENKRLRHEVRRLKEHLDHCRPTPKDDFSARLDDTDENMTSAFFIPDITVNSNDTGPVDPSESKEMPAPPELTSQSNKLPTLEITEETRNTTRRDSTTQSKRREDHKSPRKSKTSKSASGQKVAFSIPEKASKKSRSNVANQGSKRRDVSKSSQRNASKGSDLPETDPFDENDTTGLQSVEDASQDYSMQLDVTPLKSRKQQKDNTTQSQRSDASRPRSRALQRQITYPDATGETMRSENDTCPALSSDAKRILNGLCEHECQNCTVCSRISSHRGVLSASDYASGKKRVSIPRPVPVTDRDISAEDPTMRPANSPGHALAMVIKGLEDESKHLEIEFTRLQAQYHSSDKALGRRDRLALSESLRTLLKRLEAKNDQIYSLYDVLEGQKAAGQAMSEEEIEMTVLNITGMTVRDVTGGSEQLTWDGIQEA